MTSFIHKFHARMLEANSRSLLLARKSDAVIFMKDGMQNITVKGGWFKCEEGNIMFHLLIS